MVIPEGGLTGDVREVLGCWKCPLADPGGKYALTHNNLQMHQVVQGRAVHRIVYVNYPSLKQNGREMLWVRHCWPANFGLHITVTAVFFSP